MRSESEANTQDCELRNAIIAYFVNAAQAFGIPKSVGEIYGLFFSSVEPLTLDQVIEELNISKGSASQGIRFLRSINALNLTYKSGDRRDHYIAETSLRRIADGLIKERIKPHLASGATLLSTTASNAESTKLKRHLAQIETIQTWNRKVDQVIPFVSKLLGELKTQKTI